MGISASTVPASINTCWRYSENPYSRSLVVSSAQMSALWVPSTTLTKFTPPLDPDPTRQNPALLVNPVFTPVT
ncbi:MAG: hypothetical protein BWY79_01674 [Actinobacteria bacterium ADurb.Bin444]|nr:MAG: hypothetical protein BWY79_01674 [Actinobacteria bacterium ADurb.Bin444]